MVSVHLHPFDQYRLISTPRHQVLTAWILDTVHQALITTMIYNNLIHDYGNLAHLNVLEVSLKVSIRTLNNSVSLLTELCTQQAVIFVSVSASIILCKICNLANSRILSPRAP